MADFQICREIRNSSFLFEKILSNYIAALVA
jgi:hypothetical protein